MYIDTHAHYVDPKFDIDRIDLLDSMPSNNVGMIINPGCNALDSFASVLLAERFDYVYAAVGIHPEELPENFEADFNIIASLTDNPKCIAIGEIGLDYYWDASRKEDQKYVFERQIELALDKNLPVIIHDRDAHGDCFDIVQNYKSLTGVFHCYSGSAEMAKELLKMGWYLGFDGPVTYKNARKAIEVLDICPIDRILIETDSPYLPPVPKRGTRNDSSNLKYIVEKIAEVKGLSSEEIETVTTDNAVRLFKIQ